MQIYCNDNKCSAASVENATQAVDSAPSAFPAWSKTRPVARREVLLKAADVFLARKDELIGYMCEETGALVPYAEFILMLGANFLRDVAGNIEYQSDLSSPYQGGHKCNGP